MLNIQEINNTINELEKSNTTFDTCMKLSSLYIVRDNYKRDEVSEELDDILPQYSRYCDIKREYQLNNTTSDNVLLAMNKVCKEIEEFIKSLYSHTDMKEERDLLDKMLSNLKSAI